MEPDPLKALDPLLRDGFVLPLLHQLRTWSDQARAGRRRLPLIGLNGPVGAGKTSLGRQLEALAPRFGLRLLVASIDDLYLGWPERSERLAGNPFGVSRVPPGSHDLPLLLEALNRWREGGSVRLPRFDKTLASGQGDRAGWCERSCDALVLEGWLMGCRPLSAPVLAALMETIASSSEQLLSALGEPDQLLWSGCGAPTLNLEEWRWLPRWNQELEQYQPVWLACDGLWLLRPLHWDLPRRWRFQAEARQRRGGGGWLPPAELQRLVRASLCSLPPALYQDPLNRQIHDSSSYGSGSTIHHDSGQHNRSQRSTDQTSTDHASIDLPGTRPQDTRLHETGVLGTGQGSSDRIGTDQPVSHDIPPVQAVAWLDGRRRCRGVRLQASLSSCSSETG